MNKALSAFITFRSTDNPAAKKLAQRKFSKSDRHKYLAHFARTRGLASWVMQWVCSLWDSLQGLGVRLTLPHLTLRTGFPLPLKGRPHGHREAPLLICNFLRVTQATLGCKSQKRLISRAVCDFPENNNGPRITQPKAACGKASDSVGNSSKATPIRLKSSCKFDRNGLLFTSLRSADGPTRREMRLSGRYGREMIPRSVSPFTKNCMASATSSKPMILTRMRMPVSPSTIRIRPAPASTK